jgi:hypothetical protein
MTQDPTIALLDATQFDISGPIVISYSVSSVGASRSSPTATPIAP